MIPLRWLRKNQIHYYAHLCLPKHNLLTVKQIKSLQTYVNKIVLPTTDVIEIDSTSTQINRNVGSPTWHHFESKSLDLPWLYIKRWYLNSESPSWHQSFTVYDHDSHSRDPHGHWPLWIIVLLVHSVRSRFSLSWSTWSVTYFDLCTQFRQENMWISSLARWHQSR